MDDITNPDGTYPFCGLDARGSAEVPDRVSNTASSMKWWADDLGGDLPDAGLTTLVRKLPRATTATAGWKHPVTGEWIETGKHNAIIEPSVAERMQGRVGTREQVEGFGEDPETTVYGDRALFQIPTDDYTIINPATFFSPLATVLREADLGDSAFGEFRVSRGGGRVSADVFFDGKHVECPTFSDDRNPIVVGLQFDYDFFGDTALRIRGMGMDYECVNSLRQITDGELIKHAGDIDSRVEWEDMYHDLLEELDLKTDQLSRLIHAASQQALDVSELPDGFADDYGTVLEAFYGYAGLPDYLAEVAAADCRANAEDPFAPSYWTLHRGATFAVSHHARGDVGSGSAIDRYNRLANDMLMNPAETADSVEREFEAQTEQTSLDDEGGGQAEIASAFESVRERRDAYESREEEIRQLLMD